MKIDHFLKKNNNLDLIRIFLASLVILGHTIPLNGDISFWVDLITFFLPVYFQDLLLSKFSFLLTVL